MFARAATGRILRGADGRAASVSLHPFLARPKKKAPTKCYCYVPFVWQALVAVLLGLVVLMSGTAMTTAGYYARNWSSAPSSSSALSELDNSTQQTVTTQGNNTEERSLHNLAYAGPVLMGIGCFVIVISCVHVCEMRDQKIKEFEVRRKAEAAKKGGKKKNKSKMYDLIIHQLKKKDKDKGKPCKEKDKDDSGNKLAAEKSAVDVEAGCTSVRNSKDKHREILKGFLRRCSGLSVSSTKSEFSNISVALRRIPMDIFTVDVDGNKDTSLKPILVKEPKSETSMAQISKKYPSDPCLSQSLNKGKRKPWKPKYTKPPDIHMEAGQEGKLEPKGLSHDNTEIVPLTSSSGDGTHSKEVHEEEQSGSSAIPPVSDKESPSNVIVHQASIHYDFEQEEPAPPHRKSALNSSSNSNEFPGDSDHGEDEEDLLNISRCDTRISLSGVSPFLTSQKEDRLSDDDSLVLGEGTHSKYELNASSSSKATNSQPSDKRAMDLENWSGDQVLKEWREHNGNLSKPRDKGKASRRATIPNGDCLQQRPVTTNKPTPPTSLNRGTTKSSSTKVKSGLNKDFVPRFLHVRTDPRASELTVRVTQVPYSHNLQNTSSGASSRPPSHPAALPAAQPMRDKMYRSSTNPEVMMNHYNKATKKPPARPVYDLPSKPPRGFKS